MQTLPSSEIHRFQSIAKGQLDLGAADGDEAGDEEKTKREADFAALLPWLAATLGDHVKAARLSSRLTTSAACVVGDTGDMTPMLEKMYRAMGQELAPVKRILEINPKHPLITGLRAAQEKNPDDPALPEIAEIVLGTALLAEGGDLPDPARFARQITERLSGTL